MRKRQILRPDAHFPFFVKKPSRKAVHEFWSEYDAKAKFLGKRFRPENPRRYFRLGNTLVTVREFDSVNSANLYVMKNAEYAKRINEQKPRLFRLVPTNIIDVRGNKLIEQVYLAPNIEDFFAGKNSKFSVHLRRRLRKEGLDSDALKPGAKLAWEELSRIKQDLGFWFDFREQNTLFLNYSRRSRQFLFSMPDISFSQMTFNPHGGA